MSGLVDIYVGRQPIFDTNMKVIAYELLFRNGGVNNYAEIIGGDEASAQVMINVFGDLGIKEVVGDHKAFINFTEGLLLSENTPFFPCGQAVVEGLEDVKVTPELIGSLKKLREAGYTIALDDYVFNPDLAVLEEFADIIKVDILLVGPKRMLEHVRKLKDKGIKLLAEKVETREQFDFCRKIGFDLFQGYFFAKPEIIKGQRLPNNKLSMVKLLASVYDPDINMDVLSDIIGQDVTLSQKLLKFASTVGENPAPIKSIRDAVTRFGLDRLKSWSSMLVLSGVDDKPVELFTTSLARAKFCELVGAKIGDVSKDAYFTVGLFSTLDALMNNDMTELLGQMSFDPSLKEALLLGKGNLGMVLKAVKGLEMGQTNFELPKNITATELSTLYLEALKFAESIDLR
jgi:EAL and modified HD-GYP domain-containing signal transduction protein